MKAAAWRREALSRMLKGAKEDGYGAILWEVEDKVRWASCPEVAHPEAMDTPLAPVRPNISQGVVRARNVTYTLTETRGEKLTRLWTRPRRFPTPSPTSV